MQRQILRLILIGLLILSVHQLAQCWQNRSRTHGAGVMAPQEPSQVMLKGQPQFEFKSFNITKLASYDITARVLHKKHYRFGREAKLAPYDLALGWKRMSDETLLSYFKISQSNRFYWWSAKHLIIPEKEVIESSANVHIIPGNDTIKAICSHIRRGDIIRMQGYLVRAAANDGWHWSSSLRRSDTGSGACELLYVETIEIVK